MPVVKKNVSAEPIEPVAPVAAPPATVTPIKAASGAKKASKPKVAIPPPPPPQAPTSEVPEVDGEIPARVGRKQIAEMIQEKVKATGKAVPISIAEIMVVAYEGVIMESLHRGQEVNLPGFGKYTVVHREETQRRNPATGQPVTVPAHNVVRFKLGSALKASVSDVDDPEGDE